MSRAQVFIVLKKENAVTYLLRDTFSVAIAAGSVNGTLADTGQARTVTDANSVLSITGGKASVATGGAAAGDPGLWYPAQTRAAGMVLLASFVQTTASLEIGWDATAAGSIAFCARSILGSLLAIRDNATAITVEAALSSATTYRVALVLRGTGMFYFIKGGVFTNWTLIWISATGNGNLLPGFTNVGTTDVYTVDDMRIPVPTYIPNPLAYDTFTRSNGALGSTETTGPDSQAIAALTWLFTGVWVVSSNTAIVTPNLGANVIVNGTFAADTDWTKGADWAIGSGVATGTLASANLTQTTPPLTVGTWYQVVWTLSAFAAGTVQTVVGGITMPARAANGTYSEICRATSTAFLFTGAGFTGSLDNVTAVPMTTAELFASVLVSTADVMAEVAITIAGGNVVSPAGLVLNLDSTSNPQNFIQCYLDTKGNCVLEECVAGTYTTKFTTAITYSAGAILRVIRDGTSCRVFYNNAAVSTVQTMTANTNTQHGMLSTRAGNNLDRFTIFPRGKNGEYVGLDAY